MKIENMRCAFYTSYYIISHKPYSEFDLNVYCRMRVVIIEREMTMLMKKGHGIAETYTLHILPLSILTSNEIHC